MVQKHSSPLLDTPIERIGEFDDSLNMYKKLLNICDGYQKPIKQTLVWRQSFYCVRCNAPSQHVGGSTIGRRRRSPIRLTIYCATNTHSLHDSVPYSVSPDIAAIGQTSGSPSSTELTQVRLDIPQDR